MIEQLFSFALAEVGPGTDFSVLAYVGPGLTGSVVSVLLGILGVIGLIAAVIFVRPVIVLMQRMKGRSPTGCREPREPPPKREE